MLTCVICLHLPGAALLVWLYRSMADEEHGGGGGGGWRWRAAPGAPRRPHGGTERSDRAPRPRGAARC